MNYLLIKKENKGDFDLYKSTNRLQTNEEPIYKNKILEKQMTSRKKNSKIYSFINNSNL